MKPNTMMARATMTGMKTTCLVALVGLWLSGCIVGAVPTPGEGSAQDPATATGDAGSLGDISGGGAQNDTASDGGTTGDPWGIGNDDAGSEPEWNVSNDVATASDASSWVSSSDAGGGWSTDAGAPTAKDAGATDTSTGGATGLSQAGAQDFGLFRQILESGGIPSPDTLDPLGFFNEHKLDYPKPKCGADMCMHGLLGQMGNMITGSTCTVVQIGLNTAIKVDKKKRPPLHVVFAIDTSTSMGGKSIGYVKAGLQQMLDHMQPVDAISIVGFSTAAKVALEAQLMGTGLKNKSVVETAINGLKAEGKTNLYDGMFTAFGLAAKHHVKGKESRVVLLSDGIATTGIKVSAKLVSLAKGYAVSGIGVTTIGLGKSVDLSVLRDIAEVGAGNFYFLDKSEAVKEVFTEEVKTFLVPIALDVKIKVDAGNAWVIGGVYGTNGWKGGANGGNIHIPSLFLAGRTDASKPLPGPPGTGRRGGGGAIMIELVPLQGVVNNGAVAQLDLKWKHPQSGKVHVQKVDVKGYAGSTMPDGGFFSHPTVEKGFVMLNILVGFGLAAQLATDADTGAARGVLLALGEEVNKWLKSGNAGTPDPDIEDDMKYVVMFIKNLKKQKFQTPLSKPPEPWPKD